MDDLVESQCSGIISRTANYYYNRQLYGCQSYYDTSVEYTNAEEEQYVLRGETLRNVRRGQPVAGLKCKGKLVMREIDGVCYFVSVRPSSSILAVSILNFPL